MKTKRVLVACLVAGSAIAGPQDHYSEAARTLLRKPQCGFADITFAGGKSRNVEVLRVTDRFVAVREAGACENVPLEKISRVKWPSGGGGDGADFLLVPVWAIPLLPVVFVVDLATQPFSGHDANSGDWESVQPEPDGSVNRVLIERDTARPGSGYVFEQDAFVRKGHYRLEDGKLQVTYDDGGTERVSAIRFECDQLFLEDASSVRLTLLTGREGREPRPGRPERVSAPIVGRWQSGPTVWDFRRNGICQIERVKGTYGGTYFRTKTGLKVNWTWQSRQGEEEWQAKTSKGHLFVTARGRTVEYARRTRD